MIASIFKVAKSEPENPSVIAPSSFISSSVILFGVGKDDDGILVLGATNIPWDLDPAARRRFQRKIFISLPDSEARRAMLLMNLGDTDSKLTEDDFDTLSEKTEGFSGSDIYTLTQDAIYEPLRKCQLSKFFRKNYKGMYEPCSPSDQGSFPCTIQQIPEPHLLHPLPVCVEDYLTALGKIKPTVSEKDLIKQDEFTRDFGSEG